MEDKDIFINGYYIHNDSWNACNHKGVFRWTSYEWYCLGEGTMDLKDVSPIPLTEEILLKCGFEKDYRGYFVDSYYGVVYIYKDEYDYYLDYNDSGRESRARINNLHQLQNLYFALLDEELEIKLTELSNFK